MLLGSNPSIIGLKRMYIKGENTFTCRKNTSKESKSKSSMMGKSKIPKPLSYPYILREWNAYIQEGEHLHTQKNIPTRDRNLDRRARARYINHWIILIFSAKSYLCFKRVYGIAVDPIWDNEIQEDKNINLPWKKINGWIRMSNS